MNFINLNILKKHPIAINGNLIEAIYENESTGETKIRAQGDSGDGYYIVSESYSEVMAKIHKAKRLEIASRMFGHILQSFLGKCDGETIRKESLVMAEELIKQNEVM